MKKTWLAILTLAITAVLLVALNLLSSVIFRRARVDLTERKLYTLSDGTRAIIGRIDEPITMKFYFSRKIADKRGPGLSRYAQRVQDMLDEYKRWAGDKIKLSIIDPEPYSEEEEQAASEQMEAIPVGPGESIYFGLYVQNSTDDSARIPFLPRVKEEFLEYEITKMINTVTEAKKTVVGVVSSLNVDGSPGPDAMMNPKSNKNQPWGTMSVMKQLYDVRMLGTDIESIDKDVDVLLIIHPKKLSDKTLYAIDQFVLGGGRAMVFVDPFCTVDEPAPDPKNPWMARMADRSSDMEKIFKKWGIAYSPKKVVGDQTYPYSVPYRNAQGAVTGSGPFYPVFSLKSDPNSDPNADGDAFKFFNPKEVVTSDLKDMFVGYPGYLTKRDGVDVTFIPLMTSSQDSGLFDASDVKMMSPRMLGEKFKKTDDAYTLAAYITGNVSTAFPDGKPGSKKKDKKDKQDGKKKDDPASPKTKGEIHVIVATDVDMLTNNFALNKVMTMSGPQYTKRNNNIDFLLNGIEWLAGNSDLINLRARGKIERPFEKVQEIERVAREKYQEKVKELNDELKQTNEKLKKLQQNSGGESVALLRKEQRDEIQKLKDKILSIKKDLRKNQLEMNRDKERLGMWLKVVNIALIPLLFSLFAVGLGVFRWIRRKRA